MIVTLGVSTTVNKLRKVTLNTLTTDDKLRKFSSYVDFGGWRQSEGEGGAYFLSAIRPLTSCH